MFESCDVVECLRHFAGIVPSLVCIPMKQQGHPWWKIRLENPLECDFRDSKFLNVPRCLGPQELVPLM